jgi:hypothetical protein
VQAFGFQEPFFPGKNINYEAGCERENMKLKNYNPKIEFRPAALACQNIKLFVTEPQHCVELYNKK